MKEKRDFSFKFRLSEDELKLFQSKAEAHTSMAAMIRKAVERLDNREMKSRFERLKEMEELFRGWDIQFRGVSANLNQAMHHANKLAIGGNLATEFLEDKLFPIVKEVNKQILECKKYQKMIYAKLVTGKS